MFILYFFNYRINKPIKKFFKKFFFIVFIQFGFFFLSLFFVSYCYYIHQIQSSIFFFVHSSLLLSRIFFIWSIICNYNGIIYVFNIYDFFFWTPWDRVNAYTLRLIVRKFNSTLPPNVFMTSPIREVSINRRVR